MKKRTIGVIAGLLLAATCLGLGADRADAHFFDGTAQWSCAYTRIDSGTLYHAQPYAMGNGWVTYTCRSWSTIHDQFYCHQATLFTSTNEIFRTYGPDFGDCAYPIY